MFKMMKRGNKGFTLVELMVVMSILAVLSAIVIPAVTGTKTVGETTQQKNDLQNVQTAISKYTTDSTTNEYPEAAWTDNVSAWGLSAAERTMLNTAGLTGGLLATNYTAINFDDTTSITTSSGSTATATFVPDYLNVKPSTAVLNTGSNRSYLWLLKIGTDTSSRTVELYKLSAGAYSRVQ